MSQSIFTLSCLLTLAQLRGSDIYSDKQKIYSKRFDLKLQVLILLITHLRDPMPRLPTLLL